MRCETHPCVTSRMRLAYEMRDTSPRDPSRMRCDRRTRITWAQWCVRDNARVWHWSWSHFSAWWFPPMIRKGGRHIPAWPRVWDARHIPCVTLRMRCDPPHARVSLGAARPIPIMTSRERHITRLTSLSNITTVAYTASRVRWERFRVYFCRAYKLFCWNVLFCCQCQYYNNSRLHGLTRALGTILCIF